MELCEDAAQTARLKATQSWSWTLPDDPGAWLYRVAHNHVLDELRREKRDECYLAEVRIDYAQHAGSSMIRWLEVTALTSPQPATPLVTPSHMGAQQK